MVAFEDNRHLPAWWLAGYKYRIRGVEEHADLLAEIPFGPAPGILAQHIALDIDWRKWDLAYF